MAMDASTFLRLRLEGMTRTVVPSQPRDAAYTTWTHRLNAEAATTSSVCCATVLTAPVTLYGCGCAPATGGPGALSFTSGATPSFLTVQLPGDAPGTAPFTVEWFQYMLPPVVSNPRLFGYIGSNFALSLEEVSPGDPSRNFLLYVWVNAVPNVVTTLSTAALQNQWLHFAVVGTGTTVAIYVGGTLVGTLTPSPPYNLGGDGLLSIGVDDAYFSDEANTGFNGYITNFRWVVGTALYSGSSFTPPSAALTAVAGTRLLLLATSAATATADSSGLNDAVTNVNGVTWVDESPFT